MGALLTMQPAVQVFSGDFADVKDFFQLFGLGFQQFVHGAKLLGKSLSGLLSHLTDAKGEQQTGKRVLLALLNGRQEILCRFFAHALQHGHIGQTQIIQVGRRRHQALFHQRLHQGRTKALDIHGVTAGKMGDTAQKLCRAFGTGTAEGGFTLFLHHRCAAHRAGFGHGKHPRIFPAQAVVHAQHFGNDIACLAHQDGITDADIPLADKVQIVQGGTAHGSAGQAYWLEHRVGGQHAGTSNLDDDVQQLGRFFLGRIFVSYRPPGHL